MPNPESWLRPKPVDTLKAQVHQVSSVLGVAIVPPTGAQSIIERPAKELATRFPVRWRYYTETFLAQRAGIENRGRIATASRRVGIMNKLDAYIHHHRETPEDRVLRPRQFEALQALRDQMESARVSYRGHFRFPPRFGKTKLFSELIKAIGVKTLVVVPTLITGGQAEDELIETVDAKKLGRVFAGQRKRDRDITITTYQSLLSDLAHKRINPYGYELVILDEAHLALTEKRREAIERFSLAIKLGFTATPKYSDEKQVRNLLYPLIDGMPTREAVEEGILAPFTAYEAYIDTETSLAGIRLNSKGDYNEHDLAKAINKEKRNKAAVEIYQRKEFAGKPAFVFCAGIDHATAMAEAFVKAGVTAEIISGKNSLEEQEAIRKRFRSGETTILCSADILTTGVNEPTLQVVINARPTLSIVMAEQRGGRVLTLDPNNPRKHAMIIDVVDEDSNGVLYADVISDIAKGKIVFWGRPRERPQGLIKRIEVGAIKVNVRTREVLTILEDLQKVVGTTEEFRQKTRLATSTLVNLLGKPAEAIANNLPYYYLGRPARVIQQAKDAILALRSYSNDFDPELEIPLNVFQEMIVDTVFQRLYGDAILQDLPSLLNNLRSKFSKATRNLPEVNSKLNEYDAIIAAARRDNLTPAEREELLDRAEGMLKAFINIKREITLRPRDKASQQIHNEINEARAMLIKYRDNEQRVLIRRRVRKIIQDDPLFVLDFLNAREDYKGTEFYARLYDILDPNQVRQTIDQTCGVVFMNRDLPENNIDFVGEVQSTVQNLFGNLGRYSRYKSEIKQWMQKVDALTQLALKAQETKLDPAELAKIDKNITLYLADINDIISRILEDDSQASGKKLSRQTVERLNTVRTALTMQFNNVELFRVAARKALADYPVTVYSLLDGRGEEGILDTLLVRNIRSNANFVTVKLRGVQSVSARLRQPFVKREDTKSMREMRSIRRKEKQAKRKPSEKERGRPIAYTDALAAKMRAALGQKE